MSYVVGIDASRNRSGGAIAHLRGILSAQDPREFGVSKVHLWSYKALTESVPDFPWLVKHTPAALEAGLPRQLIWQAFFLAKEVQKVECRILLNTDAGTVCRFSPSVTMSRDMLSYESGEIDRYWFSRAWIRLYLLRYMQNRSLKHASAAIFLTRYAAKIIEESAGNIPRKAFIPHGVGENFRVAALSQSWPEHGERDIRCVYVGNADLYKHQWYVIEAIAKLRDSGIPVSLTLVGGGVGLAQEKIEQSMKKFDPDEKFVKQVEFVSHELLPSYLADSDLFVFASSCENMPNTLLEGMASGLPIACSNRGPMPEVLEDGGVYFDPENADSIFNALKSLISDPALRKESSMKARELSSQYSWERCASETWEFMHKLCEQPLNA